MIENIKNLFIQNYVVNWVGAVIDYNIKVNKSNRFNGVAEVYVHHKGYYLGCWWVGKDGDKYIFEKEEEYETAVLDISFNNPLYFRVYYKEDIEEDELTKLAESKYKQKIKEQIAADILSGKIDFRLWVSDTDGYECPPSQIKDQIIHGND